MANPGRINSIDFLRGIVMIIMALDHTRDFIHAEAFTGDPLDLATTSPLLFFTRWITHFCAPVFVFLSGTSVWLQAQRKSKKELSGFLITRGLWLIVAEFAIVTLAITFNITYSVLIFQVIGAIGISMFLLGIIIWLPFAAICALGFLIVFGHNLLDFAEAANSASLPAWYFPLHRPTFIPVSQGLTIQVFYPFVPWTGIMILGYCFGSLFTTASPARNKKILFTGLATTALFVLLRATNIYGDPQPWSVQKSGLYTIFSFIDTEKYPPSLLYSCMTLGPAIIFLAVIGDRGGRLRKAVTTFGRVPFFYYVLHFYLIHAISSLLFIMRGHTVNEGINAVPGLPLKFIIPGEGYNLGIVYLVWIIIIFLLYPLCRWYARYKQTHRAWWLSYI